MTGTAKAAAAGTGAAGIETGAIAAAAAATASTPAAGILPRGCARPLAEAYDVALLDLDGVVYLGGAAIPGAADALSQARERGMRLAFVTNNASRSPSAITAQLTGLGVRAATADVVTSAQAAARLLAGRLPAGSAVLVVGGIGLRLALRERGLRPVSTAAERPAAVVQGYAPDIGYGLLAEAAVAIRGGAWYVASNADSTLPSPRGPQPGNGALIQVLVTATGQRPVVAGKPEPALHAEAVDRTGARHPLVVGDRLDTDIEGAVRVGADSLAVLTGLSGPADLLLAGPRQRPTYLAANLAGLLEPHPAVTVVGGGFRCGGWTARLTGGGQAGDGTLGGRITAPEPGEGGSEAQDGVPEPGDRAAPEDGAAELNGGRLELAGSGQSMDGLRAACAAAWSSSGPVTAAMVRPALAVLGL